MIRKYDGFNYPKRERIKMSSIVSNQWAVSGGDVDGFDIIECNITDFDNEKGFATIVCVMKRKSDDKYFKVEYTEFGYTGTDLLDQVAVEVDRKQKLCYYYE